MILFLDQRRLYALVNAGVHVVVLQMLLMTMEKIVFQRNTI